MKENIKNLLATFNALPEEEQKRIARESIERGREGKRQEFRVENQNNAQIAGMEEFQIFCSEKNITPSKRQASKLREEFIKWYNEKNELPK